MTYSEEQRDTHKAMIRRAIALEPSISLRKLQKAIEKKEGTVFSIQYLQETVRDIRNDWTDQYENETKETVAGRFDELCLFLIETLRTVITEEQYIYNAEKSLKQKIVSQSNRIQAVKEIRECAKAMIALKMDLGILDRHIGRLQGDADITKMRYILSDLLTFENNGTNEPITINSEPTERAQENEGGVPLLR